MQVPINTSFVHCLVILRCRIRWKCNVFSNHISDYYGELKATSYEMLIVFWRYSFSHSSEMHWRWKRRRIKNIGERKGERCWGKYETNWTVLRNIVLMNKIITKKCRNGIFGFLTLLYIKIKDLSHMTPCSFADKLPNFVPEEFPSRVRGMGNWRYQVLPKLCCLLLNYMAPYSVSV